MKTSFLYLVSNIIIVVFLSLFLSCTNNEDNVLALEEIENQSWSDISTKLFEKDFNNKIIFITYRGEGEQDPLYNIVSMKLVVDSQVRLKTRSEAGDSKWIAYGKVCGVSSAMKFQKKMKEIYGDKCYEMKADVPDADGCRTMYHRACQ